MPNDLHMEPLWQVDIPTIVALSNQAFADYHVPIQFSEPSFLSFMVAMGVSWDLSSVLLKDREPAGFILIARRGWNLRVATMGFLPDFRNQGYGSQALATVIEQAHEHGDRFIELEVITANQPAFHLYKKFGFEVLQDLFGFARASSSSRHGQHLQEVDIRSVANLVAGCGAEDLPWQLSAESLACYGPPMKALHHNGAYAVISDPDKPTIALMSLIVEPQNRKAGRARALLNAIAGKYDDKQLMVPAICPAQFEPLFTSSGFQRSELSQHHMRLGL